MNRQFVDYCKSSICQGKKSLKANEQNEEIRAQYQEQTAAIAPRRFIFIDEFGCNKSMTRLYGRAFGGDRAIGSVPSNYGTKTSVIAAMGLRGIVATMTIIGSIDGPAFDGYVKSFLVSQLKKGDVIILDNYKVHLSKFAKELIESVGAEIIFLPPYSPDLNPIENCFSKVKSVLRSVAARTNLLLRRAVNFAFDSVIPQDIIGWFTHCGYLSPPI